MLVSCGETKQAGMGFGSKPQRANLEKKTRIANAVTMIVMKSGSRLSVDNLTHVH